MANIYNQRFVAGNITPISAYEGNIGQQMTKLGERLGTESEKLEQKGKKELAQAKKLYEQGLNLDLNDGINELRNNPKYSSNPQGLAEEMDKLLEKTLSDVNDDEVKTAVMVDYQLKKGTYINHAQIEFNRIQREKARSYAFDEIYSNIDTMTMAMENSLSGNASDDDIVSFQHARDVVENRINAKDIDGTYMFSDSQRAQFRKSMDKYYVDAFKNAYGSMNREQKKNALESLKKDEYSISVGEGQVNIKDLVSEGSYKDIKSFILSAKNQNENEAYDYLLSDATDEEKIAYINEQEYAGNISDKFATQARRVIKQQTESPQKSLSDASAINNVVQMASDLINSDATDEDILVGIKNIKEHIFNMEGEKKITKKDAVALMNQVNTLVRKKASEATLGISYKFADVNDLISESLSPELRDEAIRALFYATMNDDLEKVDLRSKAVDIVKGIQNKYRAKAVQDVNTIVAEDKKNSSADDFFKGFGL